MMTHHYSTRSKGKRPYSPPIIIHESDPQPKQPVKSVSLETPPTLVFSNPPTTTASIPPPIGFSSTTSDQSPPPWEDFFTFAEGVAKETDCQTMYTENYQNLSNTFARDLTFFRAGLTGKIPNEWIMLYNQYQSYRSDPDVQSYLKMEIKVKRKLEENDEIVDKWAENYGKGAKNPGHPVRKNPGPPEKRSKTN